MPVPNICSETIPRLASDLREIAKCFKAGLKFDYVAFMVYRDAGLDQLDIESAETLEQQFSQLVGPRDLKKLCGKYDYRLIGNWLRLNASVEFGHDFVKQIDSMTETWEAFENSIRVYLIDHHPDIDSAASTTCPLAVLCDLFDYLEDSVVFGDLSKLSEQETDIYSRFIKPASLITKGLFELADELVCTSKTVGAKFNRDNNTHKPNAIAPKIQQWANDIIENQKLELQGYNTNHPKRKQLHQNVRQRRTDNPQDSQKAEKLAEELSRKQSVQAQR